MLPSQLRPFLHTATLARRLFYYPVTDSTNDLAVAAARAGEPEGSVFYTDFQRRGRGRRDHVWEGAAGRGLLFSVILRPQGELREVLPVTLAAALAISMALSKSTGLDVGVKWPNDIMAGGGKLGGILAESGVDTDGGRFAVVGVGLNVNEDTGDFPDDIRERAVSCRSLTGVAFDRAYLLVDVLISLDTVYGRFRADGFAPFVSSYEQRLVHAGRRVRFERDGRTVTAVTLGVTSDGALRVRPGGEEAELTLVNETLELLS